MSDAEDERRQKAWVWWCREQKNSSIYGEPPAACWSTDRSYRVCSTVLPSLSSYLTHSLFLRPSSPTLSSRESVILSPIHTPVRPSPSIFLCLACIHRYKPERNACLLQPVWLRATLVLPRSCSAKISVENS